MDTSNIKNFVDSIEFTFNESSDRSGLFTPHHTKFLCEFITNKYQMCVEYQCNTKYTKPEKEDVLACVVEDAESYSFTRNKIGEFLMEFGYNDTAENINRGLSVFDSCKNEYNSLKVLTELNNIDYKEFCDYILNEFER